MESFFALRGSNFPLFRESPFFFVFVGKKSRKSCS